MSLVIVTEDSKSGFEFWKSVNKEILGSRASVIHAHGIDSLSNKISELIKHNRIAEHDSLLIALDNTDSMKVDGQIDIIMRLIKPIKLKHLLVTTYYCFEEVFLSFTDILAWLNIKTEQWEVDLLNTIANNILNGQDYFNSTDAQVRLLLDRYIRMRFKTIGNKQINREKVAANLLQYITSKRTGFSITKQSIGDCWVADCCKTSINILSAPNTRVKNFVRKCGMNTNLSASYKIAEIMHKSVLCTGGISPNSLKNLV